MEYSTDLLLSARFSDTQLSNISPTYLTSNATSTTTVSSRDPLPLSSPSGSPGKRLERQRSDPGAGPAALLPRSAPCSPRRQKQIRDTEDQEMDVEEEESSNNQTKFDTCRRRSSTRLPKLPKRRTANNRAANRGANKDIGEGEGEEGGKVGRSVGNKDSKDTRLNMEEAGEDGRKARDKEAGKMNGRAQFSIGKEGLSVNGALQEEIEPVKKYRNSITSEFESEKKTGCFRNRFRTIFEPTNNKLSMKLFGSRTALENERERQRKCGHWIIHPCSSFRFYWDLSMMILLLINLIILPITISFFNDDLSPRWIVFNCVYDTVFLIDIIVNFRTGIMPEFNSEPVSLDLKVIAKNYLRTWFLIDLVSSVPIDYIFLIINSLRGEELDEGDPTGDQILYAGRALRILRLAKLLSLIRLLRLSRLVRYVTQWEEVYVLNSVGAYMRTFNLICMMLLVGHWTGCLQFMVPMLQGFPPNCWVSNNKLTDAYWTEQYSWALFQAISQMLCIGYGRFAPENITDMWLTLFSQTIGAVSYVMFIAHANNLIQSMDSSGRHYREKVKAVEEYMAYRKLPRKIRYRIKEYFEHRYHGKFFDEEHILEELPEKLRKDVVNFNCRDLVASVPFFTNADPSFVTDVVTKLQYEVFQPGDIIIKLGSVGTKMYFIQEGIVDIVMKNGDVATSLSDGSYFGEICLLTNDRRVASVRAETYCNLFSLSVDHFNEVLETYPLMRKVMESSAVERLNLLGKRQNPDSDSDNASIGGGSSSITCPSTPRMQGNLSNLSRMIAEANLPRVASEGSLRKADR